MISSAERALGRPLRLLDGERRQHDPRASAEEWRMLGEALDRSKAPEDAVEEIRAERAEKVEA